jgi:tRNA(adenine34) deaminase
MRIALEEAEKAFLDDEVPVGAVLVKENSIIAATRNRKESEKDPTAHAELLIIKEGSLRTKSWRLEDSTLYVTKEPCVMCAGAMVNARLGRLVYGCRDTRYGAIESQYHIGSDLKLNHRLEIVPGILENDCSDILRKFFIRLRHEKTGNRAEQD